MNGQHPHIEDIETKFNLGWEGDAEGFKTVSLKKEFLKKIETYAPTLKKLKEDIKKYNSENKKQLFVPRGFAHGFLVLTKLAIFSYKVDNVYAPDYDSGIRWNDPILNIPWGKDESEIIVSEKDSKLPFFSEFKSPFFH